MPVLAFVAVEILPAVLASSVPAFPPGATLAASGVSVRVPGAGSAGPAVGGRVQSRRRSASNPAASGVPVEDPGAAAVSGVPAVPAPLSPAVGEPSRLSSGLPVLAAVPVEVSASGRWDCKPVSPGEPAAVPAGVIPAGAAAVPRVEVPAVEFPQVPARKPVGLSPMSAAVLLGVPVKVSAVPAGFPGGGVVLAAVVMAAVLSV